jgi:hypothetical protein
VVFQNDAQGKGKKLHQIVSLLGKSKDSADIINAYSCMIRVLPEEFSVEKMKQLGYLTDTKIKRPSKIIVEQSKMNPKFAKKLVEVDNLVNIQTLEPKT